jgi:hypothetical protein
VFLSDLDGNTIQISVSWSNEAKFHQVLKTSNGDLIRIFISFNFPCNKLFYWWKNWMDFVSIDL